MLVYLIRKIAQMTALLLIVSGCATLSKDGGFAPVEQAAKQHINKELIWQRSDQDKATVTQRIHELLTAPLTADAAVQIALLNNRGLQATFYELGISEADWVQAGRLPNPGLALSRTQQGNEVEIDRSIVFNLTRLLMMPVLLGIEQRRFEQTQRMVTIQMLSIAAETRKAYYNAVASDQTVVYMQQVKLAAEAGAELARRMKQAGNFSKLQQAREQNFYAEAMLSVARAEQKQMRDRVYLNRLLGLSGSQTAYQLPSRLPDLPASLELLNDVEQQALSQRLDIQAAVLSTEQLAKNLGLNKATRFINVLEVGAIRNSYSAAPVEHGYQVSLQLPIFDWGDAKVAKAEALYMQALYRTEEIAVNARSEVGQAYWIYRSNYDIAKHIQDEIVPLKKKISEENLLLYNGMLIDVFELLTDARSQIESVNSAIEASRDFWIAQTDLKMSLIGPVKFRAVSSIDGTTQSNEE